MNEENPSQTCDKTIVTLTTRQCQEPCDGLCSPAQGDGRPFSCANDCTSLGLKATQLITKLRQIYSRNSWTGLEAVRVQILLGPVLSALFLWEFNPLVYGAQSHLCRNLGMS